MYQKIANFYLVREFVAAVDGADASQMAREELVRAIGAKAAADRILMLRRPAAPPWRAAPAPTPTPPAPEQIDVPSR